MACWLLCCWFHVLDSSASALALTDVSQRGSTGPAADINLAAGHELKLSTRSAELSVHAPSFSPPIEDRACRTDRGR
jgi:hypothetical protein